MNVCQTKTYSQSHSFLSHYFEQSGYWGSDELRRKNTFVLSPSVYVVSKDQQAELDYLGRVTYKAVGALNNRLCDLEQIHKHPKEGRFLKLANSATKGLSRPIDSVRQIPPILKVDLIQSETGGYKIAEVDAYNPRGLGYVALMQGAQTERATGTEGGKMYPSIELLADLMKKIGRDKIETWLCIVSAFERYYEPAFKILSRALKTYGVHLRIIRDAELIKCEALLDHADVGVFIIPESLYEFPNLRDLLMEKYQSGNLKVVYPPVAYLGSKAFLPFLSEQEGMNTFVPRTALVGKNCGDPHSIVRECAPAVLKGTVSSGMKQVFFSDIHSDEYGKNLLLARKQKNPAWILQEQVKQTPVPVTVFNETGERVEQPFYLRVVAYITQDGVLDVCVTERPDRLVHGAPDCIMLPAVLE